VSEIFFDFYAPTKQMTNPNEIFCCEDLVATLKDGEAAAVGVLRQLYVTSRPLGSAGSTGVMRSGDLASDLDAKIICFDPQARAFSVVRNGNPPRPEEHVPDGDIGALLRSFVRDNASMAPVYITITDTRRQDGMETVRHVIPARQVEMQCQHGPHHTARGTPYKQEDSEPKISAMTVLCMIAAVLVMLVIYYRFFKSRTPPPPLPDTRPFVVERRRGHQSVKTALDRLR
jgi:hypothetical protein